MTPPRCRTWAVALAALALATGCGHDAPLSERDPNGAEACSSLATGLRMPHDTEVATGSLLSAGRYAVKAETKAIRDSATDLGADLSEEAKAAAGGFDFQMADKAKLRAACVDEGVDMPKIPKA